MKKDNNHTAKCLLSSYRIKMQEYDNLNDNIEVKILQTQRYKNLHLEDKLLNLDSHKPHILQILRHTLTQKTLSRPYQGKGYDYNITATVIATLQELVINDIKSIILKNVLYGTGKINVDVVLYEEAFKYRIGWQIHEYEDRLGDSSDIYNLIRDERGYSSILRTTGERIREVINRILGEKEDEINKNRKKILKWISYIRKVVKDKEIMILIIVNTILNLMSFNMYIDIERVNKLDQYEEMIVYREATDEKMIIQRNIVKMSANYEICDLSRILDDINNFRFRYRTYEGDLFVITNKNLKIKVDRVTILKNSINVTSKLIYENTEYVDSIDRKFDLAVKIYKTTRKYEQLRVELEQALEYINQYPSQKNALLHNLIDIENFKKKICNENFVKIHKLMTRDLSIVSLVIL